MGIQMAGIIAFFAWLGTYFDKKFQTTTPWWTVSLSLFGVIVVVISRALTSDSLYLRWPPRVLIEVNFPAFAQRVTVFGSTRNKLATSEGVSSVSCSVFNFLLPNPH